MRRSPTPQALVAFALVAGFVTACVIETEPAPKRPLLRDVLRARQAAAPVASVGAAPPPAAASAPVMLPDPPSPPDAFRACDADGDCAAVPPNGCCHDGRKEPIDKGLVDAYRSSFVCPVDKPRCPEHRVLDRRVPACDKAAHLCVLVPGP